MHVEGSALANDESCWWGAGLIETLRWKPGRSKKCKKLLNAHRMIPIGYIKLRRILITDLFPAEMMRRGAGKIGDRPKL